MPTEKEKHGAGKTKQEPAPTVLLPAFIDSASAVSTAASLADIPEEEIWLAKQLGVGVGTLYRVAPACSKTREKVLGTR